MTLDTMGLIGGKDVLQEISMRLEESHLAYLQLDENPLKIQARQKLEGIIKEYLCHVPNERKYVFQETADILHRSAATVKEFSGYRACTAWRALSLYAANLLAQPWRKEYRTLRTYSGYYKHEIEANLIGAELMFELMGYKHTGLGVLTLEGPIDPDRVSSVSRDAIVAFVECQILKEIWENVSQHFTISWLEVLEFRCNSVGTPDQAIRALNFRFSERMLHSRDKTSSNVYHDCSHHAQQPIGMETPLTTILPPLMPYHAMPNNYNTTMMPTTCKPDSVYPTDRNLYFDPVDAANMSNRCANPYACRPTISHYYTAAPMTTVPGHAARVPTACLIELDTPGSTATNYDRNRTVLNEISNKSTKSRIPDPEPDEIDFRRHPQGDRHDYARVEKRQSGKMSRNVDETDDWSFVYKGLERVGYSKDLGERDNVLLRKKESLQDARNSSRMQQKNSRSLVNVDQDERYEKYDNYGRRGSKDEKRRFASGSRGINFNDDYSEQTNGQENGTRDCTEVGKNSLFELPDSIASFSDSTTGKTIGLFEKNGKKYSNTLPSPRNLYKSSNEAQGTMRKLDSSRDAKHNLEEDTWNCGTCTFLNSYEREICEMCGKSRRKGNEAKPLVSGGKECPKCTLINKRNATICEACSTTLENSPTYI